MRIRAMRIRISELVAGGLVAGALLAVAGMAAAEETITYTYDARGRLILVTHAGNVNDGVMTNYQFDDADNRKRVKVTGAP